MDKILKAIDNLLEKNPAMVTKIHEHIMESMNKKNMMKCPECGCMIEIDEGDDDNYDDLDAKEIANSEMSKDALDDLDSIEEDVAE